MVFLTPYFFILTEEWRTGELEKAGREARKKERRGN
jgi:hypothetical protein